MSLYGGVLSGNLHVSGQIHSGFCATTRGMRTGISDAIFHPAHVNYILFDTSKGISRKAPE